MVSYEASSQHPVPPINLLRGWPNPSLLPADLIKQAADAALSNPSIAHDALLYGPDPGYEPARIAIAKWLSKAYTPQDTKRLIEAEHLSPREKDILYLRHRLQKGLLSPTRAPKREEMPEMDRFLAQLEKYHDLEPSIIQTTKIHKVLKALRKVDTIPRDEEFDFKKRSDNLLQIWNERMESECEDASKPAGDEENVFPERICITGGASQNLGCLLNVYTDPAYTRTIWIVAPAYFLSFRVFEDAGFSGKMRAVPEDEQGLDIEFLEREIMESEMQAEKRGATEPVYKPERARAKVYKHVVYCVPTFGNPSSRTMTLQRRQQLVRLARRFDALLVADDVYDFLQWSAPGCAIDEIPDAPHLPRLVDVDREIDGGAERDGADGFGNAASNGSFSKIAGPGVRCGWVEGTKKLAYGVSQTGTTCSGGAPSQMTSTFLTHLRTTNQLQNHIENTLIPSYATRYRALHDAITAHLLPLGFSLPQPTRNIVGGFFVWLSLPEGIAAGDLAQVCREEENVIVAHGAMFEVPGDRDVSFEGNVRLCFTWEEVGRLEEGVRRIARATKKLIGDENTGGGYVLVQRDVGGAEEFK